MLPELTYFIPRDRDSGRKWRGIREELLETLLPDENVPCTRHHRYRFLHVSALDVIDAIFWRAQAVRL